MKSKRAREAVDVVENGDIEVPSKKRKANGTTETEETNGDLSVKDVKEKKEKKDKKDKKDKKKKHDKESRKEKKERRKDLVDLPEGVDGDDEEAAAAAVVEDTTNEKPADVKKDKKDKKSKKNKKEKKAKDDTVNGDGGGDAEATAEASSDNNGSADPIDLPPAAESNGQTSTDGAQSATPTEKQDRHIVFVGNLPFSATAASITAHFSSLSPIAVRCLRNKGDDAPPCRGIAFVEFGKVWHMRTCLDKFHHSWFEDGVSPGRKINVELTAGGGGKTKQRQQKIKQKNQKLDENRAKRIEKEKTAKAEGGGGGANGHSKEQQQETNKEEWVHPSRRARMPDWQ